MADFVIKKDFLNDFPKNRTFGEMEKPYQFVTIHNAATKTNARNLGIYGNYNSKEVSYHYSIDEKEAYHLIPLNWTAWHAGETIGNTQSIAIEIARDLDYDSDLYAQAEDNAAHLAATLLAKNKLGIDRLRRHYDWNGKLCPHRMFEVEAGKTRGRTWLDFKKLVAKYLKQIHAEKPDKKKPSADGYRVNRPIPGYMSAADAKSRRRKVTVVTAGEYKVYKRYADMINVTKIAGQPGSWINPGDNVRATNTYKVKPNDSPWSIADQVLGDGTRYKEIEELNGLTGDYVLKVGQILKLPGPKPAPKQEQPIRVGDRVFIRRGAKWYASRTMIPSWVTIREYKVAELVRDRAVVTHDGIVVGAVDVKDLERR